MPKVKTLETGLKGTDNCPICGRAMRRVRTTICDIPYYKLACSSKTHHTQILLLIESEMK